MKDKRTIEEIEDAMHKVFRFETTPDLSPDVKEAVRELVEALSYDLERHKKKSRPQQHSHT